MQLCTDKENRRRQRERNNAGLIGLATPFQQKNYANCARFTRSSRAYDINTEHIFAIIFQCAAGKAKSDCWLEAKPNEQQWQQLPTSKRHFSADVSLPKGAYACTTHISKMRKSRARWNLLTAEIKSPSFVACLHMQFNTGRNLDVHFFHLNICNNTVAEWRKKSEFEMTELSHGSWRRSIFPCVKGPNALPRVINIKKKNFALHVLAWTCHRLSFRVKIMKYRWHSANGTYIHPVHLLRCGALHVNKNFVSTISRHVLLFV